MTPLQVDPTNADQFQAWDGDEGAYWARHAWHFDQVVAAYHGRLMEAAGVIEGERVLDLGCGTGQTTRDAARAAGAGSALGVDLSGDMIQLARRQAAQEGLENVTFRQADAQIHPFAAASFDLAMSRAGTMFFGDPTAAFTNIGRALCPGGRLTLLVWKGPERNRWVGQFSSALAAGRDVPGPPVGVPGPFGQADPGRVRCVLTSAGFTNVDYIGLEEPLCFGTDVEDADRFVLGLMGWMLRGLDDSARRAAMDRLTATLAAHDTGHGVLFESAAWLVEATR